MTPNLTAYQAREIMGENFFGVADAIEHLHIRPSVHPLNLASSVPFTADILESRKNTHLLIAKFSLPIVELYEIAGRMKFFRPHGTLDCERELFARRCIERARWCLIRKSPIPDSLMKSWEEQQQLGCPDEQVPSAQTLAYAAIARVLQTGEHLFEGVYLRSTDTHSSGQRVIVGRFNFDGLDIFQFYEDKPRENIGLVTEHISEM